MNPKKIFSRSVFILMIAFAALLVYVWIQAMRVDSKQLQVTAKPLDVPVASTAQILSDAIKVPTLSLSSQFRGDNLVKFHALLEKSFPKVHTELQRTVINQYSLLYKWPGSKTNQAPVLFVAHMDVVPVETKTENLWKFPPFSGAQKDGYIWGRGSMDDKSAVITLLAAIEQLLTDGFQAQRTIYIAIGHDEETGGEQGAAKISQYLASRNVKPEFIVDEGGMITHQIIAGVSRPVALIGIAEKGFASFQIRATSEGGHSSAPPKSSAIGRVSAAISRLEQHPSPGKLTKPIRTMFQYLAPEMQGMGRIAMSNPRLLKSIILHQFFASPGTNALVRTTVAPTMFNSGTAENVLPVQALATINVRILPEEDTQSVNRFITSVINDDGIQVTLLPGHANPSPVAAVNNNGFFQVQKSIQQSAAGVIVVPTLLVATTDSRHYTHLSENIYRIRMINITESDIARYHGINERLAISDLKLSVNFFMRLIMNINN